MSFRTSAVACVAVTLGVLLLCAGCSVGTPLLDQQELQQRVNRLLDGQDAAVVRADQLTAFSWQALCFRRDDMLRLEFEIDGAKHPVPLRHERFMVDEGYVAHSLEDACITPSTLIVVRRKYPGNTWPVLFHSRMPEE